MGVHYGLGLGLEYTPAMLKGFSARLGYGADLFGIEGHEGNVHNAVSKYTFGSAYIAASYKF